ncbi:MAG: UDP-glucose dehydrogenase family protein [Actinomycetes bacterium]
MIDPPILPPCSPARIAVIGAGYVGLTAAACLAWLGHSVTCAEADPQRLRVLTAGQVPIVEPGLEDLVHEAVTHGRLRFTGSVAEATRGAEIALLCIGTPPGATGDPDLRQIARAAAQVGAAAGPGLVVAVKSTVPPGTCEALELVCQEAAGPGAAVRVVSHPEFLREGHAVEDFIHPDRVVIGADDGRAADLVRRLYPAGWPVIVLDRRSSELVKYASNTFLAIKISFANEVADLCDRLGADAESVLHGVGLDERIGGAFLRPGPGYGGSCLPKDVAGFVALGSRLGAPTPLARAATAANALARQSVAGALQVALGTLSGTEIAVLGLTFKAGTDDLRDSPAIEIIKILADHGAHVTCHDPMAGPVALPGHRVPDAYEAAAGADALVVATAWPQYAELDLARVAASMRGHVVVDAVRLLDPVDLLAAGLDHYCPGRGLALSFHPVLSAPLSWGLAESQADAEPPGPRSLVALGRARVSAS